MTSLMRRATRVAEIERLRQQLNLHDWVVELSDEGTVNSLDMATIHIRDTERVAEIRLAHDLPIELDTLCIAHELVHLTIRSYELLADRLLVFVTDDQARTALAEILEDANERAVDTLAHALVGGTRFVAYGPLLKDYPTFARKN